MAPIHGRSYSFSDYNMPVKVDRHILTTTGYVVVAVVFCIIAWTIRVNFSNIRGWIVICLLIAAVPVAVFSLLYGLVKFIKWAWYN
jgi:hypothetical protein